MAIQAPNLSKEKESGGRDLTYKNLFELGQLLIEGELEKGFKHTKKISRKNLIDHLNYIIYQFFRKRNFNKMD
jgi:hypothetical protein